MKPERIEIRFLNISYRTDGRLSRSPEANLKDSFCRGSAGGIPLPEDARLPAETCGKAAAEDTDTLLPLSWSIPVCSGDGFFSDKIIFRVQKKTYFCTRKSYLKEQNDVLRSKQHVAKSLPFGILECFTVLTYKQLLKN
jgi:hypothetical protein